MKPWERWEAEVATTLGLTQTRASGSMFHDTGDAVTRDRTSPFPLWADAKFTERSSFALNLSKLLRYEEQATEAGKRFVLPLRFGRIDHPPQDYLVIGMADFAELLSLLPKSDQNG